MFLNTGVLMFLEVMVQLMNFGLPAGFLHSHAVTCPYYTQYQL